MKKLFYSALALVIATLTLGSANAVAAEKEYEVNLPNFTSITADSDFQLTVTRGNAYSVTLYVEETLYTYVQAGVKGTTLSISVDSKKIPAEIKKAFRGKGNEPVYRAVVTMPGNLQTVELMDKAVLVALDDVFDEASFRLVLSDNSNCNPFTVNSKSLDVKLDKRANAEFTAESENVKIDLSGSSNLSLTQKADVVEVYQAGSSNFLFNGSSDKMALTVKGTAKSVLNGTVPTVNYVLSGSSNVNAVNLVSEDAFVEMNSICTLVEAASKNLHINISNGASLTFKNDPVFHITAIKVASVVDYDEKK